MTSNSVNKKLVEFISQTISYAEFEDILLNQATEDEPAKVGWITETGKRRYYDMYWIDGPVGKTEAGKKASETKAEVDMYNIPVVGEDGEWRTLDFNTVYKVRFNNKTFKVNN